MSLTEFQIEVSDGFQWTVLNKNILDRDGHLNVHVLLVILLCIYNVGIRGQANLWQWTLPLNGLSPLTHLRLHPQQFLSQDKRLYHRIETSSPSRDNGLCLWLSPLSLLVTPLQSLSYVLRVDKCKLPLCNKRIFIEKWTQYCAHVYTYVCIHIWDQFHRVA